jgi:hypothetical protein
MCGSVLVDAAGIPRYWSSVWTLMLGPQLAESTLEKKLRYIDHLYQHTDGGTAGICPKSLYYGVSV